MARSGVTYGDVAKAANATQHQGQNPTVDRVLAHLGTGSKSTIAPFLKQWKSDNSEPIDTGGLPNDVLNSVKSIHDCLQQAADDKIKQVQEKYQSLATELRQQLSKAELIITQVQSSVEGLETQVESLHSKNKLLYADLEGERVKTAKLETALSHSSDRLADAKAAIQEQKQEIRQIRSHFEHYQTSVAEDRQQEREQHRAIKAQLDDRIQELSQQHKNEVDRYQVLEATKQQTEQTLVHLSTECEQVKQHYQAIKLNTARKEDTVKHLKSEAEILREQIAKLEARFETISKENAGLTTTNRMSEQNVARLNQQASEANDKITMLADENQFIMQEKAVLQGQIKQIQAQPIR